MLIMVQRIVGERAQGRRFTDGPVTRDPNDIMDEIAEKAFLAGSIRSIVDIKNSLTEIIWFSEAGLEIRRVAVRTDPASRKNPGTDQVAWWLKEFWHAKPENSAKPA